MAESDAEKEAEELEKKRKKYRAIQDSDAPARKSTHGFGSVPSKGFLDPASDPDYVEKLMFGGRGAKEATDYEVEEAKKKIASRR